MFILLFTEAQAAGRPEGGREAQAAGRPEGGREAQAAGRPEGWREAQAAGRPEGGREAQAAGRPEGGREAQEDRLSVASMSSEFSLDTTEISHWDHFAEERRPQPTMLQETGDMEYSRFMARVRKYQGTLLVRAVSSTCCILPALVLHKP